MSAYWPFIVFGIFAGSIYGLAAMGVVLTYKTVGVFNFAYGAVAMFCAFTYWQLHVGWHLSTWIALPVLLIVVAPVVGFVFERLFRPVVGLSAEVQIVISLGALAALQALVPIMYGTSNDRALTPLFPTSTFLLGAHLHVGYDQLGTLLVSLAMGAGLWWLLRRTRFGVATRAVVDNRDLASMMGIDGNKVRRVAWIVSSVFAALVGVLLSPSQGLDVYVLTVTVIYAFAPAVLGRLVSLPLAYAGGIALGVIQSVLSKWGSSGTVADLEASIPYLALFALLVVYGKRLKEIGVGVRPVTAAGSGAVVEPDTRRRRGPDRAVVAGGVAFLVALALPLVLHGPRLGDVTFGAIYALVALTLVVLTGWAGQISLAQFSFVGVGAFTAGHLAGAHGQHFVLAALVGMAIAVPLGLLVGLPSLRLSGLYLALATMAFALLMDTLVFSRPGVSGGLTGITVARPSIAGVSFTSTAGFYELVVGVLGVVGFATLAIRRGPIGRRLQIMRDSPLAASTLGVNLTTTKLAVFAVCGSVAALGGAFFGAKQQAITPTDFSFSASLGLLLLVVLGGRSVISGAVIAGAAFAVQLHVPASIERYVPLAVAAGVIGLSRTPEGTVALAAAEARRVVSVLRPLPRRRLGVEQAAAAIGALSVPAPGAASALSPAPAPAEPAGFSYGSVEVRGAG
ncbi:MAG TPA: ABC transporter permease [Acidimicrobiales bacterium]|nr:ABC transporter permease [Acidimicrobiales bacterium]